MRAARAATILAISLVLVAPACGRFARRGEAVPTPLRTANYGAGIEETLRDDERRARRTGTVEVTVLDRRTRLPLTGARVEFRGPQRALATTDAAGRARAELRVGRYVVEVLRCGPAVLVEQEVLADATVEAGAVTRGAALIVDTWAPRYRATESVSVGTEAPWPRGSRVVVGVRIEDGCDYSAASGVDVRGFGWRTSANLALVAIEKRASRDGFARITVMCTDAGGATIEVYDRARPSATVDVLLSTSRPPDGRWCA